MAFNIRTYANLKSFTTVAVLVGRFRDPKRILHVDAAIYLKKNRSNNNNKKKNTKQNNISGINLG